MSSFDETFLVFRDNLGEHFYEAVCNDFCDNIIASVIEGDRPKAGEELGSFLFRDEG